jgi:flavin-dependent dehydrogenase
MERRDLVIVGGGPAGTGTALALAQRAPELARRAVLLDAATFPRDKTCAGGLIPHTLHLLRELGLGLDVPAVRVDEARVEAGGRPIALRRDGCCWVIRRREFDAYLLDAAKRAGIDVREGVKVASLRREGSEIHLATSAGEIAARAVVGADGSGSLVRRSLIDPTPGWLGRAMMCDVPLSGAEAPRHYEFDFRSVRGGLAGYTWAFPCVIDGRFHWNVGAYSIRRRGEGDRLARLVDERAPSPGPRRHAHPIRLFRAGAPLAGPGALLVGDAAGVDPLLGEGISYALEYGRHAAEELAGAFARRDLSFATYESRIQASAMGKKLRRLAFATRLFYGRSRAFWFWVAQLSRRAQNVGMDWYNGTLPAFLASL